MVKHSKKCFELISKANKEVKRLFDEQTDFQDMYGEFEMPKFVLILQKFAWYLYSLWNKKEIDFSDSQFCEITTYRDTQKPTKVGKRWGISKIETSFWKLSTSRMCIEYDAFWMHHLSSLYRGRGWETVFIENPIYIYDGVDLGYLDEFRQRCSGLANDEAVVRPDTLEILKNGIICMLSDFFTDCLVKPLLDMIIEIGEDFLWERLDNAKDICIYRDVEEYDILIYAVEHIAYLKNEVLVNAFYEETGIERGILSDDDVLNFIGLTDGRILNFRALFYEDMYYPWQYGIIVSRSLGMLMGKRETILRNLPLNSRLRSKLDFFYEKLGKRESVFPFFIHDDEDKWEQVTGSASIAMNSCSIYERENDRGYPLLPDVENIALLDMADDLAKAVRKGGYDRDEERKDQKTIPAVAA